MKKIFVAMMVSLSLLLMPNAQAEIKTYIGTDDYTVGERETQEEAQSHSKARALRNAQEQAGIYISSRSRARNLNLIEDDIFVLAEGVVKIIGAPQYTKEVLSDGKSILIHTTIKIHLDTDDLERRLTEIENIYKDPNRSNNNPTTPNSPPIKVEKQIPADAVKYNGHSYKIIDKSLTWNAAKAYCESLGGHLVTITDFNEQVIIDTMLKNYSGGYFGFWLGAEKISGAWKWVSGEIFNYTNFAPGEPNNSGNYLQIYGQPPIEYAQYYTPGYWDDTTPDGTNSGVLTEHAFICEWDN